MKKRAISNFIRQTGLLQSADRVRYYLEKFRNRKIIKEGHRTWSAFHPEKFMQQLFSGVEVMKHLKRKPAEAGWLPQDVWILKKPHTR